MLKSFKLEDPGIAALFGLELARLQVNTKYSELRAAQRNIKR